MIYSCKQTLLRYLKKNFYVFVNVYDSDSGEKVDFFVKFVLKWHVLFVWPLEQTLREQWEILSEQSSHFHPNARKTYFTMRPGSTSIFKTTFEYFLLYF